MHVVPAIRPVPEPIAKAEDAGVVMHIDSDAAIIAARQCGRALAGEAGLGLIDQAVISTAISELARNALCYAGSGSLVVRLIERRNRRGVLIIASDDGPGIANVPEVLADTHLASHGAGLGLPGVKRLMDEFEIASEVGRGTTVVATKWK